MSVSVCVRDECVCVCACECVCMCVSMCVCISLENKVFLTKSQRERDKGFHVCKCKKM